MELINKMKINKMKKYTGLIVLSISILVAMFLIVNKPSAIAEKQTYTIPFVKTSKITPTTKKASIYSQGIIKPEIELNLISEVSSKVKWISDKIEPGSSFSNGDTLYILDGRDYELTLIAAKSEVINAEFNLEREYAESELAKKEWERVGSGSSGSDLALRKPQLAQALANFEAAKARLEQAKRNLKRTIFVAPFDGIVRSSNIEIGTTVFPGTLIGNIYATDSYEVRLPISDQDIPFLNLNFDGKKIQQTNQLDAYIFQGDFKWKGKIVRTEMEIDPVTRMLAVVAKIKKSKNRNFKQPLAIGQFVEAQIQGAPMKNISIIPRSFVRNNRVWVIDKSMTLRNRNVEILRKEDQVALIASGFLNGDRLLTSRLSSLVEGQIVTLEIK